MYFYLVIQICMKITKTKNKKHKELKDLFKSLLISTKGLKNLLTPNFASRRYP